MTPIPELPDLYALGVDLAVSLIGAVALAMIAGLLVMCAAGAILCAATVFEVTCDIIRHTWSLVSRSNKRR